MNKAMLLAAGGQRRSRATPLKPVRQAIDWGVDRVLVRRVPIPGVPPSLMSGGAN